jgi:hypothetical protein
MSIQFLTMSSMLRNIPFALALVAPSTFADEFVLLSSDYGANIQIDKIDDFLSFGINIGSPITYMNTNVYNGEYFPLMIASDAFGISPTDNRFNVERYDGTVTRMSAAVNFVGLQFKPQSPLRKSPMCLTLDPLPVRGHANELGLAPIQYSNLAPPGSYQSQDFVMYHNSRGLPVVHFTDSIDTALADIESSCAHGFTTMHVDELGQRMSKFSLTGKMTFGDLIHSGSMVLETIHKYVEVPPRMLRLLHQSLFEAFASPIEIKTLNKKDVYIVKRCHRDSLKNAALMERLPTITFIFRGVDVFIGPESYLEPSSDNTCTLLVRRQARREYLTLGQPFLRQSIFGIHRETDRVSICRMASD